MLHCGQTCWMVLLVALTRVCEPCSVINWQEMSLCEQAIEAQIIVYGTVTAHYPIPDYPSDSAYIAEMDIYCILKGEDLPGRVNISEAGEFTSCHHTELPVNGTFITFLRWQDVRPITGRHELVPDEVNYLSVAFEATPANFKQVGRAVGETGRNCSRQLMGEVMYVNGDDDDGAGRCGAGEAVLSRALLCFVLMAMYLKWL